MSIAEIVGEEIERSKKVHGEALDADLGPWFIHYFNNFYQAFSAAYRKPFPEWDSQTMISIECLKGHSALYRSQSPRQYFQTIDKAVTEAGISLDEIKELAERLASTRNRDEFRKLHKQFCDLILPAYIKLRELGYTQQDLTGWTCCGHNH